MSWRAARRTRAEGNDSMPTGNPITVSDHAIVRYLERALGMDMEEIRRAIVSDGVAAAVRRLGDGKYPVGRGVRIVVRNSTVVTVEFEGLGKGRKEAQEAQGRSSDGGIHGGQLDDVVGGSVRGDRSGVCDLGRADRVVRAGDPIACEEREGDR